MKKKFTLLMASMMLLGASAAQAWNDAGCCYEDPCCEDQTGFYVGAFGGGNWVATSNCGLNRRSFDVGYVFTGSIGYRWCHNVRFEFEYGYRNNQGRHHNNSSSDVAVNGCESGYGRHNKTFYQNSYLFNAFYDLPSWGDCFCINLKPFIGAGIGYAQSHGARHHQYNTDETSSYGHRNHRNGFAWQLIAGLAYPICDELDLSLEYRFFKTQEHRIYNNSFGAGLKYYF